MPDTPISVIVTITPDQCRSQAIHAEIANLLTQAGVYLINQAQRHGYTDRRFDLHVTCNSIEASNVCLTRRTN